MVADSAEVVEPRLGGKPPAVAPVVVALDTPGPAALQGEAEEPREPQGSRSLRAEPPVEPRAVGLRAEEIQRELYIRQARELGAEPLLAERLAERPQPEAAGASSWEAVGISA